MSIRKVKTSPALKAQKPPQAEKLLVWYDRHRRIMPWRALSGIVADPYHVWLSEIMLQQTTVVTVVPYFQKFIKRWPTIRHLAKAPLNDVMKMWAGLGYYRRARNLHACAKIICTQFGGQFPSSEKELLALPGFGPYTAAALRTIAFDQRANVVDGNVERVMARIFAIRTPLPQSKNMLRDTAEQLLPNHRYGDYAQALMDLGATICTPRNPKCDLCPWQANCRAQRLGIEAQLPRKKKQKKKPVKHTIAFVLKNSKGALFLQQRPAEGLLGGMMEVPSSPWLENAEITLSKALSHAPAKADWQLLPEPLKHVFSHFELQTLVAIGTTSRPAKGRWATVKQLEKEALPSLMRKILRYALKSL